MELADRIRTIIKVNNLTSSSFADRLGVQRSGVSHILNGRNRPSMDFLLKVLEAFPRVDAGWLLTGKSPTDERPEALDRPLLSESKEHTAPEELTGSQGNGKRSVEKIVVFYSDHTFEAYNPSNP